ncbi:MAG: hypothetical protein C4523_14580, partial [Myxococcales bacterium]
LWRELGLGSDILAAPGLLKSTTKLDARLAILPDAPAPLKHRQRVHVHLGTADLLARVRLLDGDAIEPGGEGLAQLLLESPTAARRLDRFIVRRYSPQATLGGGVILDANPATHRRRDAAMLASLRALAGRDEAALLLASVRKTPFAIESELAAALSLTENDIMLAAGELAAEGELIVVGDGTRLAPTSLYRAFLAQTGAALAKHHAARPLSAGLNQEELPPLVRTLGFSGKPLAWLIEYAVAHGDLVRPAPGLLALPSFKVKLDARQQAALGVLESMLQAGGLTPPGVAELTEAAQLKDKEIAPLLGYLVDTGRAVRLEKTLFFHGEALGRARDTLAALLSGKGAATVAEIRDVLGASRKFIIPVLEYFDAQGFTVRDGDLRRAGPRLPTDPADTPREED